MKIDLAMIEKMVAAGASGAVVLAYLQSIDDKKSPKRTKERVRQRAKRANKEQQVATNCETERETAISGDSVRARVFALIPRLVGLGAPTEKRAGSILGQWCKITGDDAAAIEAAVAAAEKRRPADAIGYIRACLQQRNTINGHGNETMDAFDRLADRAAGGSVAGDPPMRDITPKGD